jgi:N-acetylglucosamine-6-phosphate deacetylase
MPRPLVLTDCRLYDAAAHDPPTTVWIVDGRIRAVGPTPASGAGPSAGPEAGPEAGPAAGPAAGPRDGLTDIGTTHHANVDIIHCDGRVLLPGLIDLHVHGAGGADVLDGSLDAMTTMATSLARAGTTAFLATTFLHPEHGDAHLPAAAEAVGRDLGGAQVLGLHLEGPFINVGRRGGIPEAAILSPTPEALDRLLERTDGRLRMTTMAPELPGAMALLPRLEDAGVIPSFGHSDANYDEACAAFDAGVRHVTHLYNAMRPLHHREPGPLPAIFERPEVVVQLIVDGAHVAPPVVRWTAAVLGTDRCACITDGLRASGLPDGRYDYGGVPFESRDGVARYLDGSLVGTTLSMMEVVRRFLDFTRVPFATAVDTASRVPARVLGLADRKGWIAEGYDADLVLLDHDGRVHTTVVAGSAVYRRP